MNIASSLALASSLYTVIPSQYGSPMSFDRVIGTKPCKKNWFGSHCATIMPGYHIPRSCWPCLVIPSQLRKGKSCSMTVMAAFVHFQNWSVENVIGVRGRPEYGTSRAVHLKCLWRMSETALPLSYHNVSRNRRCPDDLTPRCPTPPRQGRAPYPY
jgi:hypothetical protein